MSDGLDVTCNAAGEHFTSSVVLGLEGVVGFEGGERVGAEEKLGLQPVNPGVPTKPFPWVAFTNMDGS